MEAWRGQNSARLSEGLTAPGECQPQARYHFSLRFACKMFIVGADFADTRTEIWRSFAIT